MIIEINNRKINAQYYEQINASKTIVFLHEALGSVAQWRDFPQKLGKLIGCNVLIYDRFGHGLSDPIFEKRGSDYLHKEAWEVTPSVLKHFNIENPILFGHSDGGTMALLYAAKFSTYALITEAAHVLVEDITLLGIRHALQNKAFLIERLKKYHGEKAKDLFFAWADTWLNPTFRDWDITTLLSNINCPSLILQGEKDDYATPYHLDIIVENIGINAQKVLIPNCGHTPHKEHESFIIEKVMKFLKF